ncbi:MAG: alpha/beta family hydrolase [Kineosporiaceae bacterium]
MTVPERRALLHLEEDVDGVEVVTSSGPARVSVTGATGRPAGTLVLTHGAGGGVRAPDLGALAATAHGTGFAVVAVEQPYRVAGRRSPPAPVPQDAAWVEVLAALAVVPPLVLAGRSNGARVACRTAAGCGAAGVVALAFPVHPPGRPDSSRLAELAAAPCPVLVVQGERDPFGVPGRARGRRIVVLPGAVHDLRRAEPVIQREVRTFLRRIARSAGTTPVGS